MKVNHESKCQFRKVRFKLFMDHLLVYVWSASSLLPTIMNYLECISEEVFAAFLLVGSHLLRKWMERVKSLLNIGNANAISCNWTKTHLSFRASSSSYQFNVISQSVAKNYLFKPPSPFHVIYNWTWKHFLPGIVAVCTNLMWTVAASPWSLYINHLRDFVWSVIGFFC